MKSRLSRRDVILGSLLAGGSLGIQGARRAAFALANDPTAAKQDPTSRALFDATDLALNDGNGFAGRNNESGSLGWGGSYVLQAYLLMYRAHRDMRYLDKLVDQFDQFLAQRDSVRGVKDYRGRSLPAWRCTSDYTCGSTILKDTKSRPWLEVRTAVRPATDVAVSISRGSTKGTWKLVATRNPNKNGDEPIVDVYDDLSPNSAQATDQIRARFSAINATPAGPRTMLTSVPQLASFGEPVPAGPIPLQAGAYVFAVQVGQITYPAAAFVRLVHETPDLQARFRGKADAFLGMIEQAVQTFDDEWRENKETGEGWYVWSKGCPNPFDGAELPHNQYLALGRTMVHLATIPGLMSKEYKDRAIKMARTLKGDLKPGLNDTYTWPYFWSKGWAYRGWKESDDVSEYQPIMVSPKVGGHKAIEDTSHAHLDVDFARLAFENDLGVFDETDMKRFANTFTRKILTAGKDGRPTTFANVDGTGGKGSADTIAAGWMPMARWDERIYESVKEIYARRTMPRPDKTVSLLMGLAYLNWYANSQ